MDGWNDADLWAGCSCSDLRVSVGVEDSANVSPHWNTMQLILSIVMTRVLYIVLVDIVLTFHIWCTHLYVFALVLIKKKFRVVLDRKKHPLCCNNIDIANNLVINEPEMVVTPLSHQTMFST